MLYNIDYKSKILNVLNKPYMEFWKVLERVGQTKSYSGTQEQENTQQCLRVIVQLISERQIYVKYQAYRRIDGELLGFFDPSNVYRGVSVGGTFYMQNDIIGVLVLTRIGSDTIMKPSYIEDRSMIKLQINKQIPRYDLW